jgi:hypothetical protein
MNPGLENASRLAMPGRLLKPPMAMVRRPQPIQGSATAVMLQLKNMLIGLIQPET